MTVPTHNNPMFSDDDIIEMVRKVEPHDFDRIAPPPVVWNNVLSELTPEIATTAEPEVVAPTAIARKQSTSWFTPSRLLSTAAVTLLMVGVAVAVVTNRGDDVPITELASAVMTDEDLQIPTDETASARFYCQGEECFVEVDLTGLPDAGDENLELWIIDGAVEDIRPIGLVTEQKQTFALPADATPESFPIIDISFEPDDGDETHSGQSVLRGIFEA